MKIFIVSKLGDSLELARELIMEGHEVVVYVKDKSIVREVGDVPITRKPTAELIKSELIIIDDDQSGDFADNARNLKRPIIGGGSVIDRLGHDKEFGDDVLEGCGLKIASENTKGLEVEVGGWFDGVQFLKPSFIALKYNRFGAGDVGPVTRGMGAVGFYKTKSAAFNMSVVKTATFLKSTGYVGYVGLDCLINDDNLHIAKWHPGLHFPIIAVFSALHNSMGNFLFKLATHSAKVTAVQPDRIGIGVAIFQPTLAVGFKSYPVVMKYALGGTVDEATHKVYKHIKKDDSYYRTDIGYNAQEKIEQLHKWGWI